MSGHANLKLLKRRAKSQIRAEAKKFGSKALKENNPKAAWKFIQTITFSNKKSTNVLVNADDANNYFAELVSDNTYQNKNKITWCDNDNNFNITNISEDVVEDMLNRINSNTAAGPDNISRLFLKKTAQGIAYNITKIFNVSIQQKSFPNDWKKANVHPVYKDKGEKINPTNYRPISLLPILGRLFEKLIAMQLTNYCDAHNIIPPEQFGFRKNSSCELALAGNRFLACEHRQGGHCGGIPNRHVESIR